MHTHWSFLGLAVAALGASGTATAAPTVEKQAHGALVRFDTGVLRLEVWSDRIVRVTYAPGAELPSIRSLSVISAPAAVPFKITETAAAVDLSTAALRARVDKKTGLVSFADPAATRCGKRRAPTNPRSATVSPCSRASRSTAWASTRTGT